MSKAKLTTRERHQLRTKLREAHDARLYRRMLAILEYDRGKPVSVVAELLGVSRQSVYAWIARFQEDGGAAGLSTMPRSVRPPRTGETFDVLLKTLLMLSPERFGYHATHWTVRLLRDQMRQNTGEEFSDDTIRRRLHRLGFVWKRPRYVLVPDLEREKNAKFAAPSLVCPGAVSCWLRMRSSFAPQTPNILPGKNSSKSSTFSIYGDA